MIAVTGRRGKEVGKQPLHYSNARSREKNRRYLVIKGGLAWLLWQGRGVNNVVDNRGTDSGLWVYQKEVTEGNTINNRAIKASQSITWQYTVLE